VEALPIEIPFDDVTEKTDNNHDYDYDDGGFKR
jgi:hypothetical protein